MTKERRLFELFVSLRGLEITNRMLNKISFRYGSYIHEFRKRGLDIETIRKTGTPSEKERDRNGARYYRLNTPLYRIDRDEMSLKRRIA